jgi:hypothetical protein
MGKCGSCVPRADVGITPTDQSLRTFDGAKFAVGLCRMPWGRRADASLYAPLRQASVRMGRENASVR